MKKLLPGENLIFKSRLSREQAITILNNNVEPSKQPAFSFKRYSYSKPYVGKIIGSYFEISRNINYKNSFLPIITGEIFNDYDGTRIQVKMKPHSLVNVFMAIWLGGVAIVCIITTIGLFVAQKFDISFLITYGMFIAGFLLFFGSFKVESSRSKKDFKKLFDAEIE